MAHGKRDCNTSWGQRQAGKRMKQPIGKGGLIPEGGGLLSLRTAVQVALYRDVGFMETIRVPGYYSGRETALRMMRMLRWPDATAPAWSPPTLDKL